MAHGEELTLPPNIIRVKVCHREEEIGYLVCDVGEQTDRPSLLFYDLTKCLTPAAVAGCPTPQERNCHRGDNIL